LFFKIKTFEIPLYIEKSVNKVVVGVDDIHTVSNVSFTVLLYSSHSDLTSTTEELSVISFE
jgi:hypothetical protein